jgi:hypothetical protein
MRKLLAATMLLMLLAAAWPVSNHSQTAATAYIQATGTGYGWTLQLVGSRGTFVADGVTWPVEYIFQQKEQLTGYDRTLWLLGRKSDNFIILHIYANDSGTSFTGLYYNYKERSYRAERFVGNYDVRGLIANPTVQEGYVPRGKVPAYHGQDFRISSEYTNLTPRGGTISYQELNLTVYPVLNEIITSTWSEFWAIAINPHSRHTYFLIFYTISPNAWVLDLWNGQITRAPLGQATITGGQVTVEHNVEL